MTAESPVRIRLVAPILGIIMLLRGTRIIEDEEAATRRKIINTLASLYISEGLKEVVIPSLAPTETFRKKVGGENQKMMWEFKDRKQRDVCLIPEVTALLQEKYKASKGRIKENVFYVNRCYRYERPQLGRYREFTQIGVELLGSEDVQKAVELMNKSFSALSMEPIVGTSVKRGLDYYTEDGFEASIESLGSQKQIAGGGKYAEGVGFAIGLDRVTIAMMEFNNSEMTER